MSAQSPHPTWDRGRSPLGRVVHCPGDLLILFRRIQDTLALSLISSQFKMLTSLYIPK